MRNKTFWMLDWAKDEKFPEIVRDFILHHSDQKDMDEGHCKAGWKWAVSSLFPGLWYLKMNGIRTKIENHIFYGGGQRAARCASLLQSSGYSRRIPYAVAFSGRSLRSPGKSAWDILAHSVGSSPIQSFAKNKTTPEWTLFYFFMAEDMGLEPTGLLHLTRFPGELLSHSVNPPSFY